MIAALAVIVASPRADETAPALRASPPPAARSRQDHFPATVLCLTKKLDSPVPRSIEELVHCTDATIDNSRKGTPAAATPQSRINHPSQSRGLSSLQSASPAGGAVHRLSERRNVIIPRTRIAAIPETGSRRGSGGHANVRRRRHGCGRPRDKQMSLCGSDRFPTLKALRYPLASSSLR